MLGFIKVSTSMIYDESICHDYELTHQLYWVTINAGTATHQL